MPTRTPMTDSPWFWLSVFLCGGLVALSLAAPKYQHRQTQLERQFVARQRSGHAVPTKDAPGTELVEPTWVPLRPLILTMALLLALATSVFWAVRRSQVLR